MRDWLTVFVSESPPDFFLNGSKQLENFTLLMQVSRMSNLSKTTRQKKWTLEFVADKLAILLVLRQQVVDERESRKKNGVAGHHAQPRTKLRRLFSALHAKYLKCELLYAEDQRQDVNRQEQTPSLNYQASAVLSRVLAGSLENNLVRENQMLNGRLEDDLMQDAKTNTALDLLQNSTYAIDLCLRRKLSKEVSLTRDVRLCGDGVDSEATVAVAGGADDAAVAGGVAKKEVHSIQQAHQILKERAKGGKRKAGDMTPSDTAFSKSAGSHHHFSFLS